METFVGHVHETNAKTNAGLTWQYQYMRDLQLELLLSNVGGGVIA